MTSTVKGLVEKLRAGLARHRGKTPSVVLEKAARAALAMAMAPVVLRACDEVGPRARSLGRTIVDNRGHITIGADFAANGVFCAVELASGPGGLLAIGDGVTVNYGTTITATREIRLGHRVSIGPHCILCDSDVPAPLDAAPDGGGRPIILEDGVWLAGRVTVLPGAHIGAGATVSAGSIVSGFIPPGTVAAGIPARPLRVPGATRQAPSHEARRAPHLRGLVLTDFPAGELCALLRDEDPPFVDARTERFDGSPSPDTPPFDGDLTVVWTTPESALPALQELLSGDGAPDLPRVLAQAGAHAERIADLVSPCRCVIVPTWALPPERRTSRLARALAAANGRLADRLADLLPVARVIDASRFCDGPEAWSQIMMYSTGVPYSLGALSAAARDIKSSLRESRGETRTALLLDIPPPAADAASLAAAADLKQALTALHRRGVAVHLAEPGHAPPPADLGLSTAECVLISISAAARARAREAFPDMLVPDVPADPLLLARSIRALRAFGGT